jgi:preprotein translocase subunit SecD
MDILRRRASAAAYQDVVVHAGSETQTVVVEAPGIVDGHRLVPLLTSRGRVVFIDTNGQSISVGEDVSVSICEARCTLGQYTVVFRGEDVDVSQVHVELDPNTQQPLVTFAFKGNAQQRFADHTGANIGNYLTITLDGKVIESAVIQSQITGPAVISGNFSASEAKTLAAELTSGALPSSASRLSLLPHIAVLLVPSFMPLRNDTCYTREPSISLHLRRA